MSSVLLMRRGSNDSFGSCQLLFGATAQKPKQLAYTLFPRVLLPSTNEQLSVSPSSPSRSFALPHSPTRSRPISSLLPLSPRAPALAPTERLSKRILGSQTALSLLLLSHFLELETQHSDNRACRRVPSGTSVLRNPSPPAACSSSHHLFSRPRRK